MVDRVITLAHLGVRNTPIIGEDADKKEYTLFQSSDMWNWVVFTLVFFVLVIFDNVCLHRGNVRISFGTACAYTVFWIFLACCFAIYIFLVRGPDDAFSWGVGYLLEWMLSVDNLFVFHLVFKLYGTPDHLKHKPLFYGIVGAVVFRMVFFCLEAALLHSLWWMHFVFGIFLIYTGINAALSDDDDNDPRDNPAVKCLVRYIPLINGYDNAGAFFVRVKIDRHTGLPILPEPAEIHDLAIDTESDPDTQRQLEKEKERVHIYSSDQWYTTPRSVSDTDSARSQPRYEWRATLLLLVVLCLEATDIIFAIDSVSAIIAEIPDLYLAYTACVFAMLGLRAMFFVIERMVDLFEYLKYGVAAILVFIGIKLMLKGFLHVPPVVVLLILVGTLTLCIVASIIKQKCFG
jgi:tellurite resistance protein TerC